MGQLIDGVWCDDRDARQVKGHFVRTAATFRNWVTQDGTAGPSGRAGFKAEAGRYHLYVSLACPWAHRTLLMRKLKGLETIVSHSVVHWRIGTEGWTFEPGSGVIADDVNGTQRLHEIYTRADPRFTGRVTVPLLWDKHTCSIVSNESSDIMRMFNSGFDAIGANSEDFYPAELRAEIDTINGRVYSDVNNGVYQAGFATTQQAYEEAIRALFTTLDWLNSHLATHRYLLGSRLTEADFRLFTTLIRFDIVYFGHFKCNLHRVADYSHLWNYTCALYQVHAVRETINFDHIKHHYYRSHLAVNPSGIVPVGPDLDFGAQHDRNDLYRFSET